MKCDFAGIGVDEVAVGQQAEVGVDLISADPGDGFRNQFLLSHFLYFLQGGIEGLAVFEALESRPK